MQISLPPSQSAVGDGSRCNQLLVMEAGVIQCDILNHSRYQLQSEEQTQTRSRRTRRTGKGARSN
jgi:hypothetical protein